MLVAQLCLLLGLLLACSFVPGFFFVRSLRWTPLEKLCGSVGLSIALIYLSTWAIYLVGPQSQRAAYRAVAAVVFVLGFLVRQDILRLIRMLRVRQAILGYLVLLLGAFLMLGMVRVYSGAGWAGDWVEHFQRSLFFLYRLSPQEQVVFFGYAIPARPPMMNVAAAFFLGIIHERHELFQATFTFLNLLMFLPCFLLLPALAKRHRRYAIPLVAMFAASPVVMENVTYTWTKGLTAFYVILALALYLAGWRKNDNTRIAGAFLALAPAILVHYSAGPYVVFLVLHYLARFIRRRPVPWRQLAFITTTCSLFLATWFGWSLVQYGARVTFSSNTTVAHSAPHLDENLRKIAWNLYASTVPLRLRGDEAPFPPQRNFGAFVRDEAFMVYQLNLVFGMGLVGGPLALWLLFRAFGRGKSRRRESRFWMAMIAGCVVVGIAVVGERDMAGVPHATLLTMQVLGLSLLASSFASLGGRARALLIAGCLVDFSFGVLLHARVQSYENTSSRQVFGNIEFGDGRLFTRTPNQDALTGAIWNNWAFKHEYAWAQASLSEMPKRYFDDASFQQSWPAMASGFRKVHTNDRDNWGGWFSRHGGVLTYLGDRIAGESGRRVDAAALLFAVVFLGVAGAFIRFSSSL